jgi:hypothetical protein
MAGGTLLLSHRKKNEPCNCHILRGFPAMTKRVLLL